MYITSVTPCITPGFKNSWLNWAGISLCLCCVRILVSCIFGKVAKFTCFGGLFKWTSSELGLLGKEHHARLIQGSVKLTESEQQVHLQLSVAFGVQGTVFDCCIPVSSLQYQLIGKLLGVGPFL